MTSVAVIGAGDVGGAVAQALATRDRVSRVLLVDAAANVAAGKALDIQQSGAVSGFHTRLEGTDDLTRAMGAAACVIADRHGQPSAEWIGDDGVCAHPHGCCRTRAMRRSSSRERGRQG